MTEDHHEASVSIISGSLLLVAFVLLALCFFLLLSRRKGAEGREHKGKEGAKIECEKDKGNRNKGTEMHGEDGGRGASQSLGWHYFWVSVSVCFCSLYTLFLFSCSPLLSVYFFFCALPCSH